MATPVFKTRKLAVNSLTASGKQSVKINQGKKDIIALEVQSGILAATAFGNVNDPLESLFQRLKIVGDGEDLIDLTNGAQMRLAHFLTRQYLNGQGDMPYEFIVGDADYDYYIRLHVPVMVKAGQFVALDLEIEVGDLNISTGAETVSTTEVRALYGKVAENWYVRTRRFVVSAADSTEPLRFYPTPKIPLAMASFVFKDLSAYTIATTGGTPAAHYVRDWFDSFDFERGGEIFLDNINHETVEQLTEDLLKVRFNDYTPSTQTLNSKGRGFMQLPAISDTNPTTLLQVQNYQYVVSGIGIVPDSETFFEITLSGAAAASRGITSATIAANDIVEGAYWSVQYPAGVGRPIEKQKT